MKKMMVAVIALALLPMNPSWGATGGGVLVVSATLVKISGASMVANAEGVKMLSEAEQDTNLLFSDFLDQPGLRPEPRPGKNSFRGKKASLAKAKHKLGRETRESRLTATLQVIDGNKQWQISREVVNGVAQLAANTYPATPIS